jgi:hypothetical protein
MGTSAPSPKRAVREKLAAANQFQRQLHQRERKPLVLHPLLAQQHTDAQKRCEHRADEY